MGVSTVKNRQDDKNNTYVDSNGVERYRGSNNRVESSSSNGSSGSLNNSANKNTGGNSGGGSSGNNNTGGNTLVTMSYGPGKTYGNKETAFTWNDNGNRVTTFSNATTYEDALREAIAQGQISNGATLSTAFTYGTQKGDAYYKGENNGAVSGGDLYSSSVAAKDNTVRGDRDSYAEALGMGAIASSALSGYNNGKTLDSNAEYLQALANYYYSLSPEEQGTLDNSIFAETRDAVDLMKQNGYTPNGTVATGGSISNTNQSLGSYGNMVGFPNNFYYGETNPSLNIGANNAPSYGYGGSMPEYNSPYADVISELLNSILNRDAFSYDVNADPLYKQYKSQYMREGQRAASDTLAEAASMAGGMNSYAISAANQAQNYYNAQLGDVIPELYQLAYGQYLDGVDRQIENLGLVQMMDETDYSRYRDTMADWRNDRDFAYNQYVDALNQSWKEKEWNYNTELNSYANAYSQAMEFLSNGIMPSNELLTMAGISEAEAQAYVNTVNTPKVSTTKSSTGGGSGNGYSGDGNDDGGKTVKEIPLDQWIENKVSAGSRIYVDGYGYVGKTELNSLINSGKIGVYSVSDDETGAFGYEFVYEG